MNDKWIEFAIRIQSIAQSGLQYGKDKYDRERYEELRKIAAEMLSLKTDIPVEKIRGLFCNETGYQTPKIDTRAAVFNNARFCLYTKATAPGRFPADGATLISPLHPTLKKRFAKRRALLCNAKKSSPFRTGEGTTW